MTALKSTDKHKTYQRLPLKPRVLIVDDQSTTRNILQRLIKNSNHNVTVAGSGEQALQYMEKIRFSLVLLDIVMPEMSGFDVLKQIRKKYSLSELPVIMVTVKNDSVDILKAFSLGANDYVAKPLDLPVICARIEAHLAHKQSNDEIDSARKELKIILEKERIELLSKNRVIKLEKEQRKKAEKNLYASEVYFQTLIENAHDIIAVFEEDGTVVYESSSIERILGYKPEERRGKKVYELVHPEDLKIVADNFSHAFKKPGMNFTVTARFRHKDGSWRSLEAIGSTTVTSEGKQRGVVNARDITERSYLSEQLSYQASHDTLTGLINRQEFERRLHHALEACRTEKSESALFYLDLDQFKIINDNCGHVAGDELLKQVSGLLRKVLWKRDTLARLGGDEFGVLLEHCTSEQADKVVKRILKLINDYRFDWEDQSFSVSLSVGLAPISENSKSSVDAMKQADAARYAAKEAGRNRSHIFHDDDEILRLRQGEMRWVARINQALSNERFCLYAQPIVAINQDKNDCGDHYEFLLRMRDDSDHLISPSLFLPAAERYNLSQQLDTWVVNNAFDWLIRKPHRLAQLSRCSINLSAISLGNKKFLDYIVQRINDLAIPPEKICFEVTETATIANLSDARNFIHTLKELGCFFALDDFGSGLSSFAYLKSLPVDYLKIDGMFVKDLETNVINHAMVKSINEIGKVMGKETIAEFVETEAIMEILKEIGVDFAQGYYIDKPKPIDTDKLTFSNR
jgi:diguanylate cyclase (GGDEF)-like protein/PAS domain S-box-containing protein